MTAQRVRVLHVANLAVTLNCFVEPLVARADADGFDFFFAAGNPAADDWFLFTGRRGRAALASWPHQSAMVQLLAKSSADIVHVHTPSAALALLPTIRKTRSVIRWVYTARGGPDEGSLAGRLAWRAVNPASWGYWNAVNVLNQAQHRALVGRARSVFRSPGRVIKLPVGGSVFRAGEQPTATRTRGAKAPLVLAWVGRLDRDKRPEDLIRVVDALNRRGVPTTAIVLGDALPGDRVSPHTRAALAAHPQIEWKGWVPDTLQFLRESDLLISTSVREGFGMAPVEAAAVGVPTIGYWTRGTAESITGVSGQLVAKGDVDGLVQACVDWYRSSDRYKAVLASAVYTRGAALESIDVWNEVKLTYLWAMQGC